MTATGFEVMREALLRHDTVALLLLFTSATVADDQIFDDPIAVLAATERKKRAAGIAFFESKIRPLLVKHRYDCHSAEAGTLEGDLRLDDRRAIRAGGGRGAAVVPGRPNVSLLWRLSKRRLEAEAIHDAMLAVSGELDTSRQPGALVGRVIGEPISLIGLDKRLPKDLDGSRHRSTAETARSSVWNLRLARSSGRNVTRAPAGIRIRGHP